MISRITSPATCWFTFESFSRLEERERLTERFGRQFAEVQTRESRGGGIGPDARTATGGAGDLINKMVEPMAIDPRHPRGLVYRGEEALVLEALSLERETPLATRSAVLPDPGLRFRVPCFSFRAQFEPGIARALGDDALVFRGQFREGRVEVEPGDARERLGERQPG